MGTYNRQMEILKTLVSAITGTIFLSWVAILVGIVPSAILAQIFKEKNLRGTVSPVSFKGYFLSGLVGSLAGNASAITAMMFALWWACHIGDQVCHDGQAGMGLIVTVPAGSLFGSIISSVWTRLISRVPAEKPWASIFRYSGPNRLANWVCAAVIQMLFWSILTLILARISV
jgi:hypothetical protein